MGNHRSIAVAIILAFTLAHCTEIDIDLSSISNDTASNTKTPNDLDLPDKNELRTDDERPGIDTTEVNDTSEELNDDQTEVDATGQTTDVTVTASDNIYGDDTEESVNQENYNVQVEASVTTRSPDTVDGVPPNDVESDKETDYTGQRNPKTDNSLSKQTPTIRTFEKPKPLASMTKSSTLRSWLEDSWLRPPAGILVPLRPAALSRAMAVWNDLIADGLNLTDIVIVGYDANGVNWRSRHSLQPSTTDKAVSGALSKLLRKYQGVYTDVTSDGTMRALTSAAKLVPYDSALFVITDRSPGDAQRLPLALRALVEKRLKVYTIWTDPAYPSAESELALQDLKNISSHTEGEVLPYALDNIDDDPSALAELQQWNPEAQPRRARLQNYPTDNFDTLLMRKGEGETISLGIPIENGVTALKIYLEGAVEHAVLYPPNDGAKIDLYNSSSIRDFSPSSHAEGASPREIYLVFPTSDDDGLRVMPSSMEQSSLLIGAWHLSVRCAGCLFKLRVAAASKIHASTIVEADTLKLKITGPVASIRDVLLVDDFGVEIAKLPFSYQPTSDTGEMTSDIEADIPLPDIATSNVYVRIFGRDFKGEPFTRLSRLIEKSERLSRSAVAFPTDAESIEAIDMEYGLPFARAVSQVVNQSGSVLTSVQIGLSSRLHGAPGDRLQLYFEVTNYRDRTISFNFGAVGELRFLTGIEPRSQTIASGQTATVIVSLLISSSALSGARDLITFTAYGNEEVSLSVYVYVNTSGIGDISPPGVRHSIQGSCLLRQGSDCGEHTWAANVVAQDSDGLLRLTSSPSGLIYDGNFISGTRDEVSATYRATCCATRVVVNAVDAFGNTNSYVIDVAYYWPPAAIAALVLGIIIFIAIIALIIFLIYWCVRRRKEVRDLPTYSSRNVN